MNAVNNGSSILNQMAENNNTFQDEENFQRIATKSNLTNLQNTSFDLDLDDSNTTIILTSCEDTDVEGWDIVFEFVFHGVLLNCVGMLGLVGNLLSIFILSRPQMKGSTNCILIGLATYDSILIITSILMFGIPAIYKYTTSLFSFYNWEVFPYITPCVYAIGLNAQTTSAYLTLCVTLERYVAVCQPLKARSICTYGRARTCVIILGTASLIYNIPRFLEVTWTTQEVCGMNRTIPFATELRMDPTYVNVYLTWMYTVVMNIFPFSCLAIFNLQIYFQIRKANQERAKLSRLQQREIGLATMLMCVVIVFFACNILAVVNNVLEVFHVCGESARKVCTALTQVSNLLVTLNSSVNFVIYCIYGDKFKRLFCSLFCKHCGAKEDIQHIQRYTTTRGGGNQAYERSSTTQIYETIKRTSTSDINNALSNEMANSRLKTIKEGENGTSQVEEIWKVNTSSESSPIKSSQITIIEHRISTQPNIIDYSGQNAVHEHGPSEKRITKDQVQIENHLQYSKSNSQISYHEQNNKFHNLNGPLIKDASTNTHEKREKNGDGKCGRQRKYKSDKMNENRCSICVHEKLIRSRSSSTPSNPQVKHQHKNHCKKRFNGCSKNKTRLIDTLPFEIGVKKSQPNLHHQCPPIHPLVQTMDDCNEESPSVLSKKEENGLINDSLSKSCSFSLKDNPQSKTSLLPIEKIEKEVRRKRYTVQKEELLRPHINDNDDTVERKCIINMSSPGVHSNHIFSKENFNDVGNDNLNPFCLRLHDSNGHVNNNKQDEPTTKINNIGRIMLPPKMMGSDTGINSLQQKPCVNLRTNISATKITMSECDTGEDENTIINIILNTECKVSENRFSSSSNIDNNIPLQNSIIKEVEEEKLLREQFQKFQKYKMERNFLLRKNLGVGCNLRYPSMIRRRSFHRSDQQQSSKKLSNNENTLPCLLYHKHHLQDKTLPNYKEISHVCKIKSNSMPRSFVERKQRRKRTKMCRKVENKNVEQKLLVGSSKDQPKKELVKQASECLKSDTIISPLPLVLNNFIPKINKNENLVYL